MQLFFLNIYDNIIQMVKMLADFGHLKTPEMKSGLSGVC